MSPPLLLLPEARAGLLFRPRRAQWGYVGWRAPAPLLVRRACASLLIPSSPPLFPRSLCFFELHLSCRRRVCVLRAGWQCAHPSWPPPIRPLLATRARIFVPQDVTGERTAAARPRVAAGWRQSVLGSLLLMSPPCSVCSLGPARVYPPLYTCPLCCSAIATAGNPHWLLPSSWWGILPPRWISLVPPALYPFAVSRCPSPLPPTVLLFPHGLLLQRQLLQGPHAAGPAHLRIFGLVLHWRRYNHDYCQHHWSRLRLSASGFFCRDGAGIRRPALPLCPSR